MVQFTKLNYKNCKLVLAKDACHAQIMQKIRENCDATGVCTGFGEVDFNSLTSEPTAVNRRGENGRRTKIYVQPTEGAYSVMEMDTGKTLAHEATPSEVSDICNTAINAVTGISQK